MVPVVNISLPPPPSVLREHIEKRFEIPHFFGRKIGRDVGIELDLHGRNRLLALTAIERRNPKEQAFPQGFPPGIKPGLVRGEGDLGPLLRGNPFSQRFAPGDLAFVILRPPPSPPDMPSTGPSQR